ncbi:hydroxymethylbilane synthase [Arcanobacterium bovis]|uniref:Hydroxymethylbilane synthase n=1 Tax=Arcanobacterium bovis TaxID=2529275 RepID=A0A4Q9V0E3_9ACTO|nr:hydroxymethylbilane synthase [Arcanobacterium bovis]TBW22098.1 hydroxymethylbilane synthase [Arcanobacterium bovis]
MKTLTKILLGTRGSELARTQSEMVAQSLREQGFDVELRIVKTYGDESARSLSQLGGVGVFAAALRHALLDGSCDIAVHSFKDLPTAPVPGLAIAAVPSGVSNHDVLCARDSLTLATLPAGASVGTGSPRRAAQIRAIRPDLQLLDIRGNIGTRLARVKGMSRTVPGDLDAVVLAYAGLDRLGKTGAITEHLIILPAAAQGRLAVECREADAPWNSHSDLARALGELNDPQSRFAAVAERAVLEGLQAGCAAPVAVRYHDSSLTAAVFSPDGGAQVCVTLSCDMATVSVDSSIAESDHYARECGLEAAKLLRKKGAGDVTDLQASKPRGMDGAHDAESLWRPGISGPNDDGADVSVHE